MNRKRIRLTKRGWALTGCSVAFVVVSRIFGIPDLFILGMAWLALILFCLIGYGFWAGRQSLKVSRHWPRHLTRGEAVEVTTIVTELPPILQNSGTLLFDRGPVSLEIGPQTTHIKQETGELKYHIRPHKTGTFALGPLTCQLSDPFDLVNVTRQTGALSRVAVWPQVTELSGAAALPNNAHPYQIALTPGLDDSTLREYVPGDDLRRIHWPTTARTGSPMIRENGSHPLPSLNLVIDPKLLGRPATREWALEHAASVGCTMLRNGYPVRLLGISQSSYLEGEDIGREQLLDQIVEFANSYPSEKPSTNASALPKSQLPGAQLVSQIEVLRPGTKVYAILSGNHGLPIQATGVTGFAVVLGNTRAAHITAQKLVNGGWQTAHLSTLANHRQVWTKVSSHQLATQASS